MVVHQRTLRTSTVRCRRWWVVSVNLYEWWAVEEHPLVTLVVVLLRHLPPPVTVPAHITYTFSSSMTESFESERSLYQVFRSINNGDRWSEYGSKRQLCHVLSQNEELNATGTVLQKPKFIFHRYNKYNSLILFLKIVNREHRQNKKCRCLPFPELCISNLLNLVNPVAAEHSTSMPLVPVFPKQEHKLYPERIIGTGRYTFSKHGSTQRDQRGVAPTDC